MSNLSIQIKLPCLEYATGGGGSVGGSPNPGKAAKFLQILSETLAILA